MPDKLAGNIATLDERGRQWLDDLPGLIDECAERWSLAAVLAPLPNLSYSYVAPADRADGTTAVLKAALPGAGLRREAAALTAYDGRGCARLLEADMERGVMLIERLTPGKPLTSLADEARDEQATTMAASVMRALWCPAPEGGQFPTIADWAEGFERLRSRFGGSGPLPERLVDRAERLHSELCDSSQFEPALLHGDLHHDNILSTERAGWLAIDPKGLIGDPAYETGALIRNLWLDRHKIADPKRLMRRRIDQLASELGFDAARIEGWAIAQAVLLAWWCIEDGADESCWKGSLAVAEVIDPLSPDTFPQREGEVDSGGTI